METHDACLGFLLEKVAPDRCQATVTVGKAYVESVYNYILHSQKDRNAIHGFTKGDAPLAYLEYTFKNNSIEQLKEFFFAHCVISFLYQKISEQRIFLVGEPIIKDVTLDPHKGARYTFEFVQIVPPIKPEWKKLPFKAPTRKNYKDLDKQVEFFLEEEQRKADQSHNDEMCKGGDWILFSLCIVDNESHPLMPGYAQDLWIRLGDEVIDKEAYVLFGDKKVGQKFVSSSDFLQEYTHGSLDIRYNFLVAIRLRVPNAFFSIEHFKKQFKLKNIKDIHTKLIEVFSCRNDISQRRETVEAVFKLLLTTYPFNAPDSLVARQQELVLKSVQSNPDYQVYKTQIDFKQKVGMLAQKQVREHIAIGYLAANESILATDEDIVGYLNLIKRPRTKEFVYFDIPSFKAKGHETPVACELIRYYVLHEKTLNHIINHLTKRT